MQSMQSEKKYMVKECVPILFTKNRKTSVLPSVKDLYCLNRKIVNEPQRKTISKLINRPSQLRRQSVGLLILRSRVQVPYRAAINWILVSIGRFLSLFIKLMSFEIIHHGIVLSTIHKCAYTTRVFRVFLYVPWIEGKCKPKGSTFGYRPWNIHKK